MKNPATLPHWWSVSLLMGGVLILGATSPAQRTLTVSGIPDNAPFTVKASADPSRLVVDIVLTDGWHAYARDVGGGEPIGLTLGAGSSFSAVGGFRLPMDEEGKLHGLVRVEQWLKPNEPNGGKARIRATLGFMVCDPMQCLPPIELTIQGEVEPLRLLVVTSSKDEHSARIEEFLKARGFAVQATTYPEVDSKTCDGHDVVLADSKLFREDGKPGQKARDFPKTKTPIVAVGFLGHLIVEAHGLAMTSGYI